MRKINLPNQITILRLILSVIFLVFLAQFQVKIHPAEGSHLLDFCAVLFLVAALTDALDGYLARKHNQVTSFGRICDPFVDKILVIGAWVFLAGDGFTAANGEKISHVQSCMLVLILGRALLVTSLRGVTEAGGKAFGANLYGKIKMVLQSTTVAWILLTLTHPHALAIFVPFRLTLVWATVIVTFVSVIPYLVSARGILSQTSVENPS